jgi:hypothetical protein
LHDAGTGTNMRVSMGAGKPLNLTAVILLTRRPADHAASQEKHAVCDRDRRSVNTTRRQHDEV